jgi:hypothetical protein
MSLGRHIQAEKLNTPGMSTNNNKSPAKKKTGFALMDAARLRAISSLAGRNSQAMGRGHQFTSEEAAIAARLRAVRANPPTMEPSQF